jgi:CheY-like chemotaxis protein
MTIKLALIDDDADDRDLFSEAVTEINMNIDCFASARMEDVLAEISGLTAKVPDAIFIDVNMPDFSGWDCLSTLKANPLFDSVPIIMYSTSGNERDREQAERLGAIGFLRKPTDFEKLKSVLKEIAYLIQRFTFTKDTFSQVAGTI